MTGPTTETVAETAIIPMIRFPYGQWGQPWHVGLLWWPCKGERREGPTVCSLVQLHLTGKARERALVLVHGLLPLWDAPCPRPIGAQRDDLDLPHWQQKG